MKPEEQARLEIDRQLDQCGWVVQDCDALNISAAQGVAVREFHLATGDVDYMLYAEGKVIATVEAKPEAHSIIGVSEQSAKYAAGLNKRRKHVLLQESL